MMDFPDDADIAKRTTVRLRAELSKKDEHIAALASAHATDVEALRAEVARLTEERDAARKNANLKDQAFSNIERMVRVLCVEGEDAAWRAPAWLPSEFMAAWQAVKALRARAEKAEAERDAVQDQALLCVATCLTDLDHAGLLPADVDPLTAPQEGRGDLLLKCVRHAIEVHAKAETELNGERAHASVSDELLARIDGAAKGRQRGESLDEYVARVTAERDALRALIEGVAKAKEQDSAAVMALHSYGEDAPLQVEKQAMDAREALDDAIAVCVAYAKEHP